MTIRYESAIHTEEHEEYLKKGLRIAINDVKRFTAADVAPKSEVDELRAVIADHKASEEQWEELYNNAKSEVERLREINSLLTEAGQEWQKRYEQAKSEVAEIFAEIYETMNTLYGRVQHSLVGMHGDSPETTRLLGKLEGIEYLGDEIAELKKKYAEVKQ